MIATSGDGTRLHYIVEGSGPPLVLVGGKTSNIDGAWWRYLAPPSPHRGRLFSTPPSPHRGRLFSTPPSPHRGRLFSTPPSPDRGRLLPVLAKRLKVIAFDNRGAGASDKPDTPYSTQLMAEDALAVLRGAGETSAHWFGLSMGGMILQQLAL